MDYEYIEDLVSKAKTNDESSKEKLVQEFRPLIINICKRTFIHGYDKNDIQNECYKTLFKCLLMYNLQSHRFVSYATNAIKNNINDLIRKFKNRSSFEGQEVLCLSDNLEQNLVSNEENLEDILCNKYDYEYLKLALSILNDEEKELIDFIFLKNNSTASYSLLKNIPYTTMIRRKKASLAKLNRCIAKYL
ncbi:sigma-70 family RNA polymerase sigma factor [Clostridium saccharobutylicum]|uniref:RNA polymerase factor sigma-70 n=1 Tax=Clostridium saccharobutylicum TaxID=169679 RepID=A0A1S8NHS2_CLOSA|nr:sigma-70 family RNA polymerase sigma factor [Clostridium saccharobutylicum]OOM16046.1 RNA polymerase factor sigma-70 [Clostridium saccharobutylicum]